MSRSSGRFRRKVDRTFFHSPVEATLSTTHRPKLIQPGGVALAYQLAPHGLAGLSRNTRTQGHTFSKPAVGGVHDAHKPIGIG
nr:hypothetical protein [Pseudomonas sp. LTJR-52]